MTEHLNEQLSAYLDGELAGEDLAGAEAHLAGCARCRAELEGLRQLVRRAAALDDRPPERDLWAGIAALIVTPSTVDVVPLAPRRRRFAFTVPQLAAAAVALMAVSAGSVALLQPRGPVAPAGPLTFGAPLVTPAGNSADLTVASYDSAIGGLQRILNERRHELDTATVRILEQSLRLIDSAITQSHDALARDPNNRYLNGHLQRALNRKLDLLRQAATLPVVS